MLDTLFIILSFLLLIGGIVGCILPLLPGLPLAYGGLFLLHLTDKVDFSTPQLIGWLLVIIVLQILDYITPLLGSKYSGGSKFGNRGCVAGTILGLFFMPWGIIAGPFLGAVTGELLGGKEFHQAIRAGIGSLIGFVVGTLLKIIVCIYFLYQAIAAII